MINPLPSPPSTSDPSNFATKADALLAALPDFVTETNAVAVAMNLNSTNDTSASSVAIGTGAKSFTASTGKSYQPGMWLVIADTAAPSTNAMFGSVTSYNTGTGALVINSTAIIGSGTKTAWTISQSSFGGALAGAATNISTLPSLTSINGGQLAGMRNAVINGAGLVQQRAAPTLTAALQYGAADRHMVGVTGGTSVSGTVGVLSNTGFSCGVGYGAIAASWTTGQFIHKHRIEGANTKPFNGQTVTVSGKIYQDTGGSRNFTVSLGKPTTTLDTFSAVTNLSTSSAIAVGSGVATTFSHTFTLGAAEASLGLEVLITDNAANTVASKNYAVSDLQFERGSTATPFEHRLYGDELALCQRYFEKSYDPTVTPGTVTTTGATSERRATYSGPDRRDVIFKTSKRSTPQMVFYSPATGATGNWRDSGGVDTATTTVTAGVNLAVAEFTSATVGTYITGHWTASAEL